VDGFEPAVELAPWRPWRLVLGIVPIGLLAGVGLGVWLMLFSGQGGLTGKYHYEPWRWEATKGLNALIQVAGFHPHPSDAQAQDAITHYFALTTQLVTEQGSPQPDAGRIAAIEKQREVYAPTIERWLEQRVTEAYSQAGVKQELPLFPGVSLVWPPIKVDLTQPVNVLVRSRRDRIERLQDTLLSPDLPPDAAPKIEDENDSADVSTLVVPLGGIATYPSMVRDDRSYDSVLFTSAHEWVHQYLAFFPLGAAWNSTDDAVVLNETAADIVAPQIAAMVQKAHPVSLPADANGSRPAGPAPDIDFNKEMHALRLQVDALLAQGKTSDAETLMEQKREYFAQHGIYIRKLNEAYFAFYGTYADHAPSSNPLGNDLQELWKRTGNVADFLRVVRDITSRAELEAWLAAHPAAPGT
jgi:hypothetical protein